jgi:uncharacterized protein YjbI with pentapeptide repeats
MFPSIPRFGSHPIFSLFLQLEIGRDGALHRYPRKRRLARTRILISVARPPYTHSEIVSIWEANMLGRIAVFTVAGFAVCVSCLGASPALAACRDGPAPGVDWSECSKSRKMLARENLSGAILSKTDLNGTNLTGANLQGADLSKANLTYATLNGANLSGANMSFAIGVRTRLTEARMSGAKLHKAEFLRANFAGANLAGADLSSAQLVRGDLRKADLTNAVLVYANLARADLRDALLEGADLSTAYMLRTRLEGVDLSSAKGLDARQLEHACGDEKTVLPPGVSRPGAWPCQFE